MYKVLLIDDEAIILQGLKSLIPWEQMNVKIVGMAGDGEEGWSYIEKYKPHIIISDIAMPNCSGIELLRRISENGYDINVILLSGYQEFQYAREAVRYGAVDYLLKPVEARELECIVRKTIQDIQMRQSEQVFRKKESPVEILFQNILEGACLDNCLNEIAVLAGVKKIKEAVCVAVRIMHKRNVITDDNKNLIRFEIYEVIQKWLEARALGTVVKKEYNTCYFLVIGKREKTIKQLCDEMIGEIREKYPVELIIGIGDRTDATGKMKYLYQTAHFSLELYYFTEKIYLDYTEISREYHYSMDEYNDCLKELKNQIVLDYQSENISEKIGQCVDLLGNIHYGNKNAVINSTILMAGEIFNCMREYGMSEENAEQNQAQFLERIRTKGTFRSMKNVVKNHYEEIFLRLKLLGRNRESMEIIKIKSYIQQHYQENITLEDLADYIGMNSSYMSVFFKREIGQNFKSYLTGIRMKEALKLMNSQNLKSYEIAVAVGYRDAKQFRENFKEYYGMSPQKYRKEK